MSSFEATARTMALGLEGLPLKVSVMGAATGRMTQYVLEAAHALGRAIAEAGCGLITGPCPGLRSPPAAPSSEAMPSNRRRGAAP